MGSHVDSEMPARSAFTGPQRLAELRRPHRRGQGGRGSRPGGSTPAPARLQRGIQAVARAAERAQAQPRAIGTLRRRGRRQRRQGPALRRAAAQLPAGARARACAAAAAAAAAAGVAGDYVAARTRATVAAGECAAVSSGASCASVSALP